MQEENGEAREADAIRYWIETLAERPPAIELPHDRPRAALRDPSLAQVRTRIPAATAARLREHARATETSTAAIALAAYAVLLGKLGATQSFVLKLREEPADVDVTVSAALRAASVPLLVQLAADEPFRALVR